MKNNKLKKTNLLNFAKTRKERIAKGDDFSKMIFKTEKCFLGRIRKECKKSKRRTSDKDYLGNVELLL